jgi:hypothetical protein
MINARLWLAPFWLDYDWLLFTCWLTTDLYSDRLTSGFRLTWWTCFLAERPLIWCIDILGKCCWLLVSMDTPVDFTATSWSPRVHISHFLIPGNVFPNPFPSSRSTCHSIKISFPLAAHWENPNSCVNSAEAWGWNITTIFYPDWKYLHLTAFHLPSYHDSVCSKSVTLLYVI